MIVLTRSTLVLAVAGFVLAACQEFVGICLVTDIPYNFVHRSIKNIM